MKNIANSISELVNPLQMREMNETVYKTRGTLATKKIHRGHRRTLLRKREGHGPTLRKEIKEYTKQINNEEKLIKNLERKMSVARKRIDFLLKKRIISMAKNLSATTKK